MAAKKKQATTAVSKQPKSKRKSTKKSRGLGTPFKPGQSGNPLGRPKKGEAFTDIIREIGENFTKRTKAGRLLYNQALALKVWEKALIGNRWAVELIYNRVDGLPVNRLQMTGANGGPIDITMLSPQERQERLEKIRAEREAILSRNKNA